MEATHPVHWWLDPLHSWSFWQYLCWFMHNNLNSVDLKWIYSVKVTEKYNQFNVCSFEYVLLKYIIHRRKGRCLFLILSISPDSYILQMNCRFSDISAHRAHLIIRYPFAKTGIKWIDRQTRFLLYCFFLFWCDGQVMQMPKKELPPTSPGS